MYILPVIAENAAVNVSCGTLLPDRTKGFNLNPGFAFTEYRVRPDRRGRFTLTLTPAKAER